MHKQNLVNISKGSSIIFTFPYNKGLIDRIKSLGSRKWIPAKKGWEVMVNTTNIDTIVDFISEFNFKPSDEVFDLFENILDQKVEQESPLDEFEWEKPNTINAELRPYQVDGAKFMVKNKRVMNGSEQGLGKAQPLDSKILTDLGWKEMGDISVGDSIMDVNGKKQYVTGVYPQGIKKIYRVKLTDGSYTECCEDHLWSVTTRNDHVRSNKNMIDSGRIKSVKEMLTEGIRTKYNNKFYLPVNKPMQFSKKKLSIDPYLMGVLLGDGGLTQKHISLTIFEEDLDIFDRIKSLFKPEDYRISKQDERRCIEYHFKYSSTLKSRLEELNLHGCNSIEKFIPKKYLYSSFEDRLALFNGLMDTDGYVCTSKEKGNRKEGCILQYSTSSKKLCEDISELIRSLGGNLRISSKIPKIKDIEYNRSYILTISLPDQIEPFLTKRKSNSYIKRVKYKSDKSRIIKDIVYVGEKEAQCISVSSKEKLYITDNYIVTHNTIMSITALESLDSFPVVIICPASLKGNWKDEFNKFLPTRSTQTINSGDLIYSGQDVYILNYDIVAKYQKQLENLNPKAYVLDESHKVKNKSAQRSKVCKKLVRKADVRFLLSGTPINNKPKELINQLEILGRLDDLGGYMTFVYRYCDAKQSPWGLDVNGASNLQELHENMSKIFYFRRNKKDVLKELPDKQYQTVEVELSNRAEYNEAERELVFYLQKKVLRDDQIKQAIKGLDKKEAKKARAMIMDQVEEKVGGAQHLVELTTLRKVSAVGKVDPAIEWIEDFIETGNKLLVFFNHKEIKKSIVDKFKCPYIDGSVDSSKRQSIVDDFQKDPNANILALNIQAAGVGLNIQTVSNGLFIEEPWTPSEKDQAEDRMHRIGQKNAVNIYTMLAKGTIDYDIHEILSEKGKITSAVNAGEYVEDVGGSVIGEVLNRILKYEN